MDLIDLRVVDRSLNLFGDHPGGPDNSHRHDSGLLAEIRSKIITPYVTGSTTMPFRIGSVAIEITRYTSEGIQLNNI